MKKFDGLFRRATLAEVAALAQLVEFASEGAALLAEADKLAAAAGLSELSLIVSDTNSGARRLYERTGYRDADRRKMVKQEWQHPGTDWVLMVKRAAG